MDCLAVDSTPETVLEENGLTKMERYMEWTLCVVRGERLRAVTRRIVKEAICNWYRKYWKRNNRTRRECQPPQVPLTHHVQMRIRLQKRKTRWISFGLMQLNDKIPEYPLDGRANCAHWGVKILLTWGQDCAFVGVHVSDGGVTVHTEGRPVTWQLENLCSSCKNPEAAAWNCHGVFMWLFMIEISGTSLAKW